MAIFSPALTSALDHSATFLTVLAGRTVKNSGSPRGPRFEPGRPQTKIHRSIDIDDGYGSPAAPVLSG